MVDGGVGISAAVTLASNFVQPSTFVARHDSVYDKESEKSAALAERFGKIPNEDIDHFEFEEYNWRHSGSLKSLKEYRLAQKEYKAKSWIKNPVSKWEGRTKVRKAKGQVQSSIAQEQDHVEELENYSRNNSVCGSPSGSHCSGSESGLNLNPSRPYRTDSCSIRATGGSPPFASMEDICTDERKAQVVPQVLDWLSSVSAGDSTMQKPAQDSHILRSAYLYREYECVCTKCGQNFKGIIAFHFHLFHERVEHGRTDQGLFPCFFQDCTFQDRDELMMFRHSAKHFEHLVEAQSSKSEMDDEAPLRI